METISKAILELLMLMYTNQQPSVPTILFVFNFRKRSVARPASVPVACQSSPGSARLRAVSLRKSIRSIFDIFFVFYIFLEKEWKSEDAHLI